MLSLMFLASKLLILLLLELLLLALSLDFSLVPRLFLRLQAHVGLIPLLDLVHLDFVLYHLLDLLPLLLLYPPDGLHLLLDHRGFVRAGIEHARSHLLAAVLAASESRLVRVLQWNHFRLGRITITYGVGARPHCVLHLRLHELGEAALSGGLSLVLSAPHAHLPSVH